MKYYVSENTLKAIKKGMSICDIYLPRHKTEERCKAVDISIIASCHACDMEFILMTQNEHVEGDFCDHCLRIHGG
jgi:hypothetical protein